MRRKHLRVSVPWPSIVLSPNARVHWGKKRTEVQKARNYAYWETCSRAHGERAVPLRRPWATPKSRNSKRWPSVSSAKHEQKE